MDAPAHHATARWILLALLIGTLTAWWITDPQVPSESSATRAGAVPQAGMQVRIESLGASPNSVTSSAGTMPGVVAAYRRTLGFRTYAQAMTALGGRFVVWQQRRRKLMAVIDPLHGGRQPLDQQALQGLSPRARNLSDEPALAAYRESEHEAVLLLVPLAVEAAIQAGLTHALASTGLTPQTVATVHGIYTIERGELILTLTAATTKSGETIPLHGVCNLSAAVRQRS